MRPNALALTTLALAGTAAAQSPAMKPFDLNMDRVKVVHEGVYGQSTTYFIPTYDLVVSIHGSVWSKNGKAQAHGKFFVDGLEAPMMRELATKLQTDLATKMKAAGFTVLLYDDLKAEPDVAKRGLDKPDQTWGFPIRRGTPVTHMIVSPTPQQQFNNGFTGAAFPYRGMAKDKKLVVIAPELTFTTPQMFGQSSSTLYTDKTGISTDPSMVFEGATVEAVDPKGGQGNIQVLQHGTRKAAENAGTIKKLSETKSAIESLWNRATGDYSMTIDPVAYSDGILRVGFAINDLIVTTLKKQHK